MRFQLSRGKQISGRISTLLRAKRRQHASGAYTRAALNVLFERFTGTASTFVPETEVVAHDRSTDEMFIIKDSVTQLPSALVAQPDSDWFDARVRLLDVVSIV